MSTTRVVPFEMTDGIETVAVLGPVEPHAVDRLAGNSSGEGTQDFLADHAQEARVFVAFVKAVADRGVDSRRIFLKSSLVGVAAPTVPVCLERRFPCMGHSLILSNLSVDGSVVTTWVDTAQS